MESCRSPSSHLSATLVFLCPTFFLVCSRANNTEPERGRERETGDLLSGVPSSVRQKKKKKGETGFMCTNCWGSTVPELVKTSSHASASHRQPARWGEGGNDKIHGNGGVLFPEESKTRLSQGSRSRAAIGL